MSTARYAAASGVYHRGRDETEVVVAGGLGALSGDNTNSVRSAEIFSLRWVL